MAIILVITLYGTTSFFSVQKDIEHTHRDFDALKAGYVADAAMAWAITVAKQDPAFTCATHDSTTGLNPFQNVAGGCANDHFDNFNFKPGAGITTDNGWITTTISGTSNTLSGIAAETLKFKIWFPTDSTMRITAQGIVNGETKTVQLIGDL